MTGKELRLGSKKHRSVSDPSQDLMPNIAHLKHVFGTMHRDHPSRRTHIAEDFALNREGLKATGRHQPAQRASHHYLQNNFLGEMRKSIAMSLRIAKFVESNPVHQIRLCKHPLCKRDFMRVLPERLDITNMRYDDFRQVVYRSLAESRQPIDEKDKGRRKVDPIMADEINHIDGYMFVVAFVTACCCGIGFPAAGLSRGPRDFDRAIEACGGGVNEEQGTDRRSVQCNLVIEKAIRVLTGHEWYALVLHIDLDTRRRNAYMVPVGC